MDRQEAISREEAVRTISRISGGSISYAEDLYDSFFPKPVVLQFVADWYEANKDDFETALYQEVCKSEENYEEGGLTDFQEWLIKRENKTFQILVNMHQFGYEVEKEPRYRVRVKGIKGTNRWLAFGKLTECWWFDDKNETANIRTHHTRKELEEGGFDWVFNCPGVEVKEVGDE